MRAFSADLLDAAERECEDDNALYHLMGDLCSSLRAACATVHQVQVRSCLVAEEACALPRRIV